MPEMRFRVAHVYCTEDMVALERWWLARPLHSTVWNVVDWIVRNYGVKYV